MISCIYRNNLRTCLIKYWFSVTSSIHRRIIYDKWFIHSQSDRTTVCFFPNERMAWRVLVSEIKGFQCLVSIFAFEFSFVIIIESGHFKYFKIFKSFLEPIGVITRYLIALFELFQVNFERSHDFWQIFVKFGPQIRQNMNWDWVEVGLDNKPIATFCPPKCPISVQLNNLSTLFSLIWNENKVRVTL